MSRCQECHFGSFLLTPNPKTSPPTLASCVAITVAIALMLKGKLDCNDPDQLETILRHAQARAMNSANLSVDQQVGRYFSGDIFRADFVTV